MRDLLIAAFREAVAASHPARVLPPALPADPARGRTLVLGCGKAAAAMAAVAVARVRGRVEGCVVTRHGHGVADLTGAVEVIEAGHPTPDRASLEAGRRILALARTAGPDDRVLVMLSGGGSALLEAPIAGAPFAELQRITRRLVLSGAPIADINAVRAQLSRIKGGGLGAGAAGAGELVSYVISDVPGDDPAHVASGPTLGRAPGMKAAAAILRRWGVEADGALLSAMDARPATAPPTHRVELLATNATALAAAGAVLARSGWRVERLGELEGEAAAVGRAHAALAMRRAGEGARVALVSGGELTVAVGEREGRGGPNQEYLAGLIAAVPPGAPVAALAADTDGVDGTEDAAGAVIDARTWPAELDPAPYLAAHTTYDLFARAGALLVTGPTRTNVNDLRIVLVG